MEQLSTLDSARSAAQAQAQILADYLGRAESGAIDLRFLEVHVQSLLQFAACARLDAERSSAVLAHAMSASGP